MNFQSKNIISLIAAVLGLIGFFFSFYGYAEYGYSYSVSGFEMTFLFIGTTILLFLAFLLFLTGIVLTLLRYDFLSGMAFIAAGLFVLIFRITMDRGGFGVWWSIIFFVIAGVFAAFGDRIPLPTINFQRPQNSAPGYGQVPPQYPPSYEAAPQEGVFYCTNCGTRMDSSMNFCPGCGTRY